MVKAAKNERQRPVGGCLELFCPVCKSVLNSPKLKLNKRYVCEICGKAFFLVKPCEFVYYPPY